LSDHFAPSIPILVLTPLPVPAPAVAAKQDRARRKCLDRLLFELDQRDVIGLWLESRQAVLNRRDQETVEAARGSRIITRKLNVKHAQPVDEPMLWLPDAVAGMTTAVLRDNNVGWLDTLGAACLTIQL